MKRILLVILLIISPSAFSELLTADDIVKYITSSDIEINKVEVEDYDGTGSSKILLPEASCDYPLFFDLNGDDHQDVVVQCSVLPPMGMSVASTIYVYLWEGKSGYHSYLEEYVGLSGMRVVDSIRFENGVLVVVYQVWKEGECTACEGTGRETHKFIYKNGAIRETE